MNTKTNTYRGTFIAIALSLAWILTTTILGTLGYYEYLRQESHLAIIITVLTPSLFFLALYITSPAIRAWTRTLDLGMLTLPHAWRTLGYMFLVLWFFGILPAGFAAPAGIGDMAAGLAAPFIVVALWLNWNGAIRAAFWFHVLGIVDFIFALSFGITGFGVAQELMDQTDPMTQFPLVIVPTAFVPLLLLSHIMVLLKITLEENVKEPNTALTNA